MSCHVPASLTLLLPQYHDMAALPCSLVYHHCSLVTMNNPATFHTYLLQSTIMLLHTYELARINLKTEYEHDIIYIKAELNLCNLAKMQNLAKQCKSRNNHSHKPADHNMCTAVHHKPLPRDHRFIHMKLASS